LLVATIAFTSSALVTYAVWRRAGGGAGGEAALRFDETVFDGGTLHGTAGATVDHPFTFKNTGSAPLRVGSIKTTCGCTAAVLGKDTYLPGEKGEIKVTMLISSIGPASQEVLVPSNAPGPPARLRISGAWHPVVTSFAVPGVCDFGETDGSETVKLTVEVLAEDPVLPISLNRVESQNRQATAELVGSERHPVQSTIGYYRNSFYFQARLPGAPVGPVTDTLVVHFNPPGIPPATVRVTGRGASAWVIEPPRVIIVRDDQPAASVSHTVTLRRRGTSLDLCEVVENPGSSWLRADAGRGNDGGWRVAFTLVTWPAEPSVDTFVAVRLRSGRHEEVIRLPVRLRSLK
jgi:hypothetical protein